MIWTFVEPGQIAGGEVEIGGPEGHHLGRVLRVRPGEQGVAVSEGLEYHFEVRRVAAGVVTGGIKEVRPAGGEPAAELSLVQALLPNPDFDAVVEGCTAVGVTRILPVVAARSVARQDPGRLLRWQAIARSSAEQSRRGRIPIIEPAVPLAAAIIRLSGIRLLILHPGTSEPLSGAVDAGRPHGLAVGPEGGWTEPELRAMQDAGGVVVTLGPRILRARLAPIVAAAILNQQS